MVRIHVVRLKHLLAGVLLAAVLILLLIYLAMGLTRNEKTTGVMNQTQYVQMEAEAMTVSASAVFAKPDEEGMRAELVKKQKAAPRVLIYHTHTHEAYCQVKEDEYVETSAWRTKDSRHNVTKVGEVLTELLTERGFSVIHDKTDHELNDLSTAYTRSLETMEKYAGEIDVFIDIHRDAYNKNGSGNPFSLVTDEGDFARLMFLVGNGEGFEEKPFYAENYALAQRLTSAVNELVPGLCRAVMVKDGRYNQHLSPKSMLIEVGHNENTLAQALNGMPYLADALERVLLDEAGA